MRRKEGFVAKNIGDENILIPTGNEVLNLNGILVLNNTARFIWEKLKREHNVEELIDAVKNEYEIEDKTAEKEVSIFIEELKNKGIITS